MLPYLTDAELFTTAIFPILMGLSDKKDGYDYVRAHYRDWFPALPTYSVWNRRLNRAHEAVAYIYRVLVTHFSAITGHELFVDTFPVVVCQAQHASRSRAAQPFVSKGYCAAKKKYYIGAKVQLLGRRRSGQMPMPVSYIVATAKDHDLSIAEDSLTELMSAVLYADKAYIAHAFQVDLFEQYTELVVPVKQKRNGPPLALFDRAYNTLHSATRQPIESLVAWINRKTHIQNASKVRSVDGLFMHIALKMVAVVLMLIFNF